jgi:hypothetical protein
MNLETVDWVQVVGGSVVLAGALCAFFPAACPVAAALKLWHTAMQYKGEKQIVLEEDTKSEDKPST